MEEDVKAVVENYVCSEYHALSGDPRLVNTICIIQGLGCASSRFSGRGTRSALERPGGTAGRAGPGSGEFRQDHGRIGFLDDRIKAFSEILQDIFVLTHQVRLVHQGQQAGHRVSHVFEHFAAETGVLEASPGNGSPASRNTENSRSPASVGVPAA